MPDTAVLSVRVPTEVRDVVRNLARGTGISQAKLIVSAILLYANSPEIQELKAVARKAGILISNAPEAGSQPPKATRGRRAKRG